MNPLVALEILRYQRRELLADIKADEDLIRAIQARIERDRARLRLIEAKLATTV